MSVSGSSIPTPDQAALVSLILNKLLEGGSRLSVPEVLDLKNQLPQGLSNRELFLIWAPEYRFESSMNLRGFNRGCLEETATFRNKARDEQERDEAKIRLFRVLINAKAFERRMESFRRHSTEAA